SYDFFPKQGATYPTYMNLNCGAAQAVSIGEDKLKVLAGQPNVQQYTAIKYTYGTKDFLYSSIQESIRIYRQAGFNITIEELPNIEHCAYNTEAKSRDYFESLLPKLYH